MVAEEADVVKDRSMAQLTQMVEAVARMAASGWTVEPVAVAAL
jgi:hypothetical protein